MCYSVIATASKMLTSKQELWDKLQYEEVFKLDSFVSFIKLYVVCWRRNERVDVERLLVLQLVPQLLQVGQHLLQCVVVCCRASWGIF